MGHRSPAPAVPCPAPAASAARCPVVGVLRVLLTAVVALLLSALLPVVPAAAAADTTTADTTTAQAATPSPTGRSASPGATPRGAERIRGTLTDENRAPVPGVVIIVERDGVEIARATSDDTGRFTVPVPGPGAYVVRIDRASLRPGLEPQVDRREVRVRSGAAAPALFAFGQQTRREVSRFDRAPQLLVGGVQFGLVLAMAAIGLSLIFGTTGLTNFAHGELITGGALLAYLFNAGFGLNLALAAVLAVVVGALIGGALDRGLWRPLRRRGTGLVATLVVSIGLALVLRYTYLYVFGGGPRSYLQYATQSPLQVGPVTVLPRDLVIVAVSLVALIGVGVVLQRTRLGKATRAVADNPALAASSGIDVERVVTSVWVAGAGLAVLGGVFLALSQQVSYQMGENVLLLLFAGVTLGGLGTAYGALVGSLVIGVFTQLSTLFIPAELQVVGALVVLILILVVRPQGILGRAERVG